MIGLDKIPDKGPALIIYYHGALPIDVYYLVAKAKLYKNRHIMAVGDRFLFKIPGDNISHMQSISFNRTMKSTFQVQR